VPDLLPVHRAIVQTLQESHRQNQELREAVLFMEQQRQASEVQRRAEDALKREQMAAMFQEGFGRTATAAESAAASAQRAYEMSQTAAQQYLLALQDARRQERPPSVNVIVSGGGGPPPPPPPGAAPLEMVPAQPPNRMELVPVENPQVKRAASRAASEEQAKRRPADELAKREPRALSRLAIAAASGSASGPERPDEVPASSSAGPEYKRPEQVAPYAAANGVAVESRAVRKLRAAGFYVQPGPGVNAGAALAGALDTSGGRPTVPNLREAGARASSANGRFFGGKAYRLDPPPTRRLRGKTPVAPSRGRSRSGARVTDKDL
jgi:hypothetical protein